MPTWHQCFLLFQGNSTWGGELFTLALGCAPEQSFSTSVHNGKHLGICVAETVSPQEWSGVEWHLRGYGSDNPSSHPDDNGQQIPCWVTKSSRTGTEDVILSLLYIPSSASTLWQTLFLVSIYTTLRLFCIKSIITFKLSKLLIKSRY